MAESNVANPEDRCEGTSPTFEAQHLYHRGRISLLGGLLGVCRETSAKEKFFGPRAPLNDI
ncbi:hypothetical protein M407DRAFT_31480 [Tulasnella calospora MUT 4182]|uniref:Uncharacterized protein n=1 Tax=Tulasnella calospora MUT 4182 TaxID=1051891 RepID=A0A0C3LBK1_9AGAM|nr:hypothetical protein M407DRAFT_31480 [Tulasnella calospora MUT 4182]